MSVTRYTPFRGRVRAVLIAVLMATSATQSPADGPMPAPIFGSALWAIPEIELGYLQFFSDGTYQVGAYEGAGVFARGTYQAYGTTGVTLSLLEITQPDLAIAQGARRWAGALWQGGPLSLSYDPDYADILDTGALRTLAGRIVLVSTKPTPEHAVVLQDGVQMIKETAQLIVRDNLIMRKQPNRDSDTNSYPTEAILSNLPYDKVRGINSRFLPLGYVVQTEGYTVEKTTIDGISAAWYMYAIDTDNGFAYRGWIFGGYLLPFSEELEAKYRPLLDAKIKALGWVNPPESPPSH